MMDQKEFLEQMDMKDNLKDQENQITSKTIRNYNIFILIIFILLYRYLYQGNQRKKKGNRSTWYS